MEVLLVPADPDEPSGPEVVHKTATLPGERERLLHEAEVLRMAAHRGIPGVAEVVVPPSADAAEPTLVTSAASGPSLAVADPLSVVGVAGVAREVAHLLAGLHEAGLVHGAVEPGHVVLDGAGGVILVGLGRGGQTGTPIDGAEPELLDPASDVVAWGALVEHLLDWSASSEEEPLVALRRAIGARPGRLNRLRGSRAAPRPGDDRRRVLAALADQARNPDPAHRPTARSLAAAVAHRIPSARPPGAAASVATPPASPAGLIDRLSAHLTPSHPAPVVPPVAPGRAPTEGDPAPGSTTAVGSGAFPGPSEAASGPDDEDEGRSRLPDVLGSGARRRGLLVVACILLALAGFAAAPGLLRSEEAPVAAPATTRCQPVTRPAADVDGDGCEEAVHWADGMLQAGTTRFALGVRGDVWAVGDWDCDGRRTPALLHDGSLAVFDAWPAPGVELRGRPVASAPGAQGISVVAGLDRCERPALTIPGAADLLVDPRRLP